MADVPQSHARLYDFFRAEMDAARASGFELARRIPDTSVRASLHAHDTGSDAMRELFYDYAARGATTWYAWIAGLPRLEHAPGRYEPLEETSAALQKWMDNWSRARAEIARTSPARVSFAKGLCDLMGLPSHKEPWLGPFADMIATGDECRLYGDFVGQKPIRLSKAFVAQALAFRDADARELPEAGLWFRAALKPDADGVLSVKRTYLDEPDVNELALDDAGLRKDAARMPRAEYWLPEWLARRARLD